MDNLLTEIKYLKNYIISWFLSFLVITFALFAIGFAKAQIGEYRLHLPVFSSHSIAVMFFDSVKNNLVPDGVTLIATSPSSAFITQTLIAIIGAFIITFPYLLYKIFQFLSPALYKKEKRKVLKILAPSMILFFTGLIFAYFVIIPPTFKILYSFNNTLGVTPYFGVSEFISWTLTMMFATGVMFMLPVFMYILSFIGIIDGNFWMKNWQIALAVIVVVSAVITPDGSGVTMILLALPMLSLYTVGAFMCQKFSIKET